MYLLLYLYVIYFSYSLKQVYVLAGFPGIKHFLLYRLDMTLLVSFICSHSDINFIVHPNMCNILV